MFQLTFGMLTSMLLTASLQGQTVNEYRVKAAFLFNFARFVEWPAQGWKSTTDPITICILGKDPFGETLAEAVNGKTVENKSFVIRQLADVPESGGCRILFVSSSERKRFRAIFSGIKTPGVLTVGEADNFSAEGGMVNFKIEDGSVRIQINPAAAAEAKLHISSKLLNLAQIVGK